MTAEPEQKYLLNVRCPACGGVGRTLDQVLLECSVCTRTFERPVVGTNPAEDEGSDGSVTQTSSELEQLRAFVSGLDLSVRARNALLAHRAWTVQQLFGISRRDILALPNVGKKTADEILGALRGKCGHGEEALAMGAAPALQSAGTPFDTLPNGRFQEFVYGLNLSVRAEGALLRNISSFSEFFRLRKPLLLNMKNVGVTTADEILQCMQEIPPPQRAALLSLELPARPKADVTPSQRPTPPPPQPLTDFVSGVVPNHLLETSLEELGLRSFFSRLSSEPITSLQDLLAVSVEDAKSFRVDAEHWFDLGRVLASEGAIFEVARVAGKKLGEFPLSFEDELKIMLEVVGERVNREKMAMYFGWDGGTGATLQQVGDRFQISRERVRQIKARLEAKSAELESRPWPYLEKAIELLRRASPCGIQLAELQLQHSGLLKRRISIPGILNAAKLTSRRAAFSIVQSGEAMLLSEESEDLPAQLRSLAARAIANRGAANLLELLDEARRQASQPDHFQADQLRVILESLRGFSWLDSDREWFWLLSPERKLNRVFNLIAKILSVTDRVDAAELYSQLGRHIHLSASLPPRDVVVELCRQHGGFHVDKIDIRSLTKLEYREELSPTEQRFFEFMAQRGGVATRRTIEDALTADGVSYPSVNMLLQSSPIVKRIRANVYGIVGHDTNIHTAELEQLHHESQEISHGWTDDGSLEIALGVTRSMGTNGVFNIPSALRRFLSGDFCVVDTEGIEYGTIRVADRGVAWGIGPYLRRQKHGCTRLSLEFDIPNRRVVVRPITGSDGTPL